MDNVTDISSATADELDESAAPKASTNAERFRHIKGWGADLDPKNRPAYPKERQPPRLERIPNVTPSQQKNIQVFHSNERPRLTPVFGTSVPPSGLSGKLRAWAFKYSENDLRHWLLLLFADRLNMGEGVISDLAHGHIPNLYKEVGGPAAFRYNRQHAIKQVAIRTAVLAAVAATAVYLIKRKRKD
jgi:hypothetical protein